MTKNTKIVAIVGIAGVVFAIVLFVARDFFLRSAKTVSCADGSHPTIDMREFSTQYWAYSGKLEVSLEGKAKASTEIDPKVLTQISDGLQEAKEFRKYMVAGYNACAITQAQYAQLGTRFHALDALAREIDGLLSKSSLSEGEKERLVGLAGQYGDLAKQLGSP